MCRQKNSGLVLRWIWMGEGFVLALLVGWLVGWLGLGFFSIIISLGNKLLKDYTGSKNATHSPESPAMYASKNKCRYAGIFYKINKSSRQSHAAGSSLLLPGSALLPPCKWPSHHAAGAPGAGPVPLPSEVRLKQVSQSAVPQLFLTMSFEFVSIF